MASGLEKDVVPTGTALDARIRTGNAVIDTLLGGGFPLNTINIVMGQPGTGKTILVEQLLFTNATAERPVLYFTTLSEPLSKVVRFVQEFSFYDESKIGTAVQYEDIGQQLADEGIGMLVPRLRDAIKTARPAVIVIDSFKALHDLADSRSEVRHLIHDLAGLLTAYDTTAFLVGEYDSEDIRHHPEFAVADGVLELSRRPLGTRDDRFFRILKLRGSHYQEGSHAFQITGDGLEVYPRLVSPRIPPDYKPGAERVSIGIPRVDAMLGGGLPSGSVTLVAGPSGSGKTTLALQFALEGARRGERAVYVNLQENPTQLRRTIDGLAGSALAAEALEVLYASPVELQIDSIIVDLFRRIRGQGVRRVVLDAVGDLAVATTESRRLHDYLYALIQHLAVSGVTSIFTYENVTVTSAAGEINAGPISYMADNLIVLAMHADQPMRRTMQVLKMRGSAHDFHARAFTIGSEGIGLV